MAVVLIQISAFQGGAEQPEQSKIVDVHTGVCRRACSLMAKKARERMIILSIVLGGCVKPPPVAFGLTEDTGGHITYALGAARGLARRRDVERVEIVTRLIDNRTLGLEYARPFQPWGEKIAILRIDSGDRRYLTKEANAADRPAFTAALIAHIAGLDRKPDLLHAHFADAADVAMTIRDRFGIPFIYTAHSLGIDKARSMATCDAAMDRRIAEEGAAIANADGIVASSRDEAERQLMLYPGACPSRIHCIPPGAALGEAGGAHDPERARRLLHPFLRELNRPMVLAIARPVRKKNLLGLVELFAADTALRSRANLVIVAGLRDDIDRCEPEQRDVLISLLAACDRHDLYGTMALPKRHSQQDVAALYALARETGGVFVNPALTEPYGLTLTEAALHGLPVVATAHGGPADIIQRLGHGLVADPLDAAAFAAAIRGLLDDRAEWTRASRAGRVNSGTLDWDHYATRFAAIAHGLVGAKPPRRAWRSGRLLLCDIDNTLTGCMAGAADMAAYLASQRDLAFGVATGRSLQEAQRLLSQWRQPEPDVLITSVGSEIYWREGGRLVADEMYATQIARGWDARAIERAVAGLDGVMPQPPVEQRRFKRSYFVEAPTAIAAVRDAVAHLPVHVIHSHGRLLDIVPEAAGKGAAMTHVAALLGIPPSRVYAAGDSGNDLDMLDRCSNGILVANYSAELMSLIGRPSVYIASRAHAAGVVEGMRAYAHRCAA